MSDPVIDSSPGLWELVYNVRKDVVQQPSYLRGYLPIAPFEVPVILSSPLIAATAQSTDARATWYVGCRVKPRYRLGEIPPDSTGPQAVVPLNRDPVLIRFPRWKDEYVLICEVPHWIISLNLYIWQYTGNLDSTDEALTREQTDLIRVDLARLEAKVNQLLP